MFAIIFETYNETINSKLNFKDLRHWGLVYIYYMHIVNSVLFKQSNISVKK